MKPGDMISWRYSFTGKQVDEEEKLWSSVLQTYVPIDGISTLIAIEEVSFNITTLTFLNRGQLYVSDFTDHTTIKRWSSDYDVVVDVI